MPRKREGTLILRRDGPYAAKITTADGKRPTVDLGTNVRAVAKRRM